LLLLVVPAGLLVFEPDWFYSGPHRDAWVYYGYFQNGVHYLRTFPELYYGSRLAFLLPGFVLHHLFSPELANLVLHVGLWCTAILCFTAAARRWFGVRAALLGAVTLGTQPYFLQAIGWNYVDGFGITCFLVAVAALVHAPGSPRWRGLLLLAGGAAMALPSTNLFFAVWWPVLALLYLGGCRRYGALPAAQAAGWTVAGMSGTFAALALVHWLLTDRWFYLGSSLAFLSAHRAAGPNPFRLPYGAWLPHAVWLVFPFIACAGAVSVAAGLHRRRRMAHAGEMVAAQHGLLLLVGLLAWFQLFGGTNVLQHFYYSSLLLPVAAFALAGQWQSLCESLNHRDWSLLVGIALAGGLLVAVLPMRLLGEPRQGPLWPAMLPAAGLVLLVLARGRGRGAGISLGVLLLCSNLLIRANGGIFWQFEPLGSHGRASYLQMAEAIASIERQDPSHRIRLWYDQSGPAGQTLDAVATAFLLCPRLLSFTFPATDGGRMCDGEQLAAGQEIALLSTAPAAADEAVAALTSIGLSAEVIGRQPIPGPVAELTVTFLRSEPGDAN
jgi:hypothetical protein